MGYENGLETHIYVQRRTMSCAGQRPVVRPWRWAWAGEEWGQGPTGPWLLHQELGAAGGHSASWRRHLVWAVVPPRLPLASPPLALRRPPLAAGPPVRFQSVCPCKPTAACVPLSRRCMPQYVGHHLRASPPAGRSCRRPWRCRVPTGARPRESAARLRSWRRCTTHLPPLSGGLWALRIVGIAGTHD